jgi:hypothetical protein
VPETRRGTPVRPTQGLWGPDKFSNVWSYSSDSSPPNWGACRQGSGLPTLGNFYETERTSAWCGDVGCNGSFRADVVQEVQRLPHAIRAYVMNILFLPQHPHPVCFAITDVDGSIRIDENAMQAGHPAL